MDKKYPVALTDDERRTLKELIAAGTAPARKLTHARILLNADQGPVGPGRVDVTAQRTKADWAQQIQALADERYPEEEQIGLVLDNLNTHTPASLYKAFPPVEAKRLAEKLEIHPTPKYGRGALQCSGRRNQVAVRDRGRPHQAQTSLSITTGVTEHQEEFRICRTANKNGEASASPSLGGSSGGSDGFPNRLIRLGDTIPLFAAFNRLDFRPVGRNTEPRNTLPIERWPIICIKSPTWHSGGRAFQQA